MDRVLRFAGIYFTSIYFTRTGGKIAAGMLECSKGNYEVPCLI